MHDKTAQIHEKGAKIPAGHERLPATALWTPKPVQSFRQKDL